MTIDRPRFSVVTPSLNQATFLRECIESTIGQDYEPYEHIVIDGGSSDDTKKILSSYSSRVRWLSEPDRGQSDALNKALRLAAGDVIVWLNADDFLERGAFAATVDRFRAGAAVVIGALRFVNAAGSQVRVFPPERLDAGRLFRYQQCCLQPSTFVARRCIDDVGFVREEYRYIMDHEFLHRVAAKFSSETVPEVLANFRLHLGSKTVSQKTGFYREMLSFRYAAGARRPTRQDVRALAHVLLDRFRKTQESIEV
jgi:glycosyltransferase involved in cell wall biosynthesis